MKRRYLLYCIFALLSVMSAMFADPFSSSMCPRGQWRVSDVATKLRQFTIVDDNGRQIKLPERIKNSHPSIAVEKHDTKKDGVFCVKWIYICPSLSGNASQTSIKKTDFIKLCKHLSDESNWQQYNAKMMELFEEYTGLEMTADNIRAAFDAGVIVSRATLEARAKQKEEEAKAARERDCYKGVFARKKQRKRLDEVTNTTARDEFLKRDEDGTWRSRDCEKRNATGGQCSICANLNSNFRRKWKTLETCVPATMKPPPGVNATNADACPEDSTFSTDVMKERICTRLDDLSEASSTNNDRTLMSWADVLHGKEMYSLDIGMRSNVSTSFCVCRNADCRKYRVVKTQRNQSEYCSECSTRNSMEKIRDKRREDHKEQRVAATSSTASKHLNDEERSKRDAKKKARRQSESRKLQRVKAKLAESLETIEMEEELIDELQEVNDWAKENPSSIEESLEKHLAELTVQQKGTKAKAEEIWSNTETQQLKDFIMMSLNNHVIKHLGKNNYEYSPYLMGLAMDQFVRGKAQYKSQREKSLVVMPSLGTLENKLHRLKVREGECVIMHEKLKLYNGTKTIVGQLMCDEMKLKGEVLLNTNSNEVVGVTEDFCSTKKILTSMIDGDAIGESYQPTTHVNQWRYRDVNGKTYNLCFWFNSGSLSGDELLDQFHEVLIRCEKANCRVLGMTSDAGGNNARLFRLLRGDTTVPEGGWLGIEFVSFKNPYKISRDEPDRFVHCFFCSTHGLKAMRNQLFTSWNMSGGNGAKAFLGEDGAQIGKFIIEYCHKREQDRRARGHTNQTRVDESVVDIDRWSKMNVSAALKVFEYGTLCEITNHIYTDLNVDLRDRLGADQFKEGGQVVGYFPAVAGHFRHLVRDRNLNLGDDQKSAIASYEWLAHVHEIFNNTLMNTKIVIDKYNID
ncbi:hypothetical protein THAOC_03886, partial [Thalassiosira oceanica]